MRIDIITIFPEAFAALDIGVVGRARKLKKMVEIKIHDLRDFTTDPRRTVDDTPFGGGAGMVLRPEPLFAAVESVRKKFGGKRTKTIFFAPGGRNFTQARAEKFADPDAHFILICGRYEGVDQRVRDALVDEEISIGNFVVAGGEVPAMAFVEAVTRLLPGMLGNEVSLEEESFSRTIGRANAEYPHWTKPANFRGMHVPEVLRTGNHAAVEKFRRGKIAERKKSR